jgi:hypothetical protein
MLLVQFSRDDRAFDLAKAGKKKDARSTMHPIVTMSSVTVKAHAALVLVDCAGVLMKGWCCLVLLNVLAQAGRAEEHGQTAKRKPALPGANC